jgi:hypothetical protein
MSAIPLSHTLVALAESLAEAQRPGILVSAAAMTVPLEGSVVATKAGPVFLAGAAHSRWRSGFLPPVHVARLELELAPEAG